MRSSTTMAKKAFFTLGKFVPFATLVPSKIPGCSRKSSLMIWARGPNE